MTDLKGRKKHKVEGNVAKIKKSEKGLGIENVGEKTAPVSKLSKLFKKKDKEGK